MKILVLALALGAAVGAQAMTEAECDAFYRLDAAEKAKRFATMGEGDKWSYVASAVRRLNDLSLEPPIVITNTLPKYGYDRNTYAMNNGLAVTRKGRVWVSWIGGEDGPMAYMLGAYSDDGGKTFGPPAFVIDPHFAGGRLYNLKVDRTALIGNIWYAPDGSLRIYVNSVVQGWDGRGSTWEIVCRNPDAPQPAWEAPKYLWHGDQHNKPEVTRDGTWLLPINYNGHVYAFPELAKFFGCTLLASTDKGKTWTPRGTSRPSDYRKMFHYCEPSVVELRDGRLWMCIRTNDALLNPRSPGDANGLMEVFSTDGGRTWTPPVRSMGIEQIMSRFVLIRLRSGNLLFVKHGTTPTALPALTDAEKREKNPWVVHYTRRRELTAFLSRDDGKTWEGGLRLEPQGGMASYPDGQQAADGSIWISYDFERTHDGQIRLSRFTEQDVLTGKPVSPKSFLGRIAIRPTRSRREQAKEQKKEGVQLTY